MSVDINFSQPSALRQFELIVEKKSIFVNAHFLAEISPYFDLLCFGNFRYVNIFIYAYLFSHLSFKQVFQLISVYSLTKMCYLFLDLFFSCSYRFDFLILQSEFETFYLLYST